MVLFACHKTQYGLKLPYIIINFGFDPFGNFERDARLRDGEIRRQKPPAMMIGPMFSCSGQILFKYNSVQWRQCVTVERRK